MSKKKVRIIERTGPGGRVEYVIQQKHYLLRWMWTDAWVNSMSGAACRDSFPTYEEAVENLPYFDGTKAKEKVIMEK